MENIPPNKWKVAPNLMGKYPQFDQTTPLKNKKGPIKINILYLVKIFIYLVNLQIILKKIVFPISFSFHQLEQKYLFSINNK